MIKFISKKMETTEVVPLKVKITKHMITILKINILNKYIGDLGIQEIS